jgi:hypothetical protein
MRHSMWLAGFSAGLLLFIAACGRNAGLPTPALPTGADLPAAAGGVDAAVLASLPRLDSLPRPVRRTSLAGPGWFTLEHEAVLASTAMTPGPGTQISLDGSAGYAYAIYGVYGFDGDDGPTSARIKSLSASGDYYLGFSDYEHGKWVFAGPYSFGTSGGTTVVDIPNTGSYVSPHSFVSNTYSATYVAIVAKHGAALHKAIVELGIHGGMLGPNPPGRINGRGGPTGMTVAWIQSVAAIKPDFSGYIVERADQLAGEFTPLTAKPIKEDFLLDTTAVLDRIYRYRVAAVDVSGHQSLWSEGLAARQSSSTQVPIVEVAGLPRTPVYSPAVLTLDMSGSYDPAGNPISLYEIYDGANQVYSSPGYALNLTLQPGCHVLSFRATAGANTGRTVRLLKVFPRWSDHAVMVSSPQTQNIVPRLASAGAVRLSDGTLYMSGYDAFIPAFCLRRMSLGTGPALFTKPVYTTIKFISKPVLVGNDIYWGISYANNYSLYHFDGQQITEKAQSAFSSPQTNDQIALATDGTSRIWSVVVVDDGGLKLTLDSTGLQPSTILVDPLPSLLDVEAVYDPVANAIWVIYSTNTDTLWLKVNPDTMAVVDNGTLAAFASPAVAASFDATNGRPIAGYVSLGNTYYTYYDGIWHLGEIIDPSGGNSTHFDLGCIDGKPRALVSDIGAQVSVYTRDALNTWSKRDVSYSSTSGMQLAFAPYTDADGAAYGVADVGVNRHTYFARLNGDGTDTLVNDTWPTTGQGLQLHGVGGADGLHVVYGALLGPAMHLQGSADGQSWLNKPMPANARQLDLAALADGTTYLAYFDGATSAKLDRWDGAAWQNVATAASQPAYRPFLAHGLPSTIVSWVAFDDTTTQWTAWQGDETNGYSSATKPFAGLGAYSGTGVIYSASNAPGNSTVYYVLKNDPAFGYAGARLGVFGGLADVDNTALYAIRGNDYLFDTYVFGRNLASAEYVDMTYGSGVAIWISNGTTIPAARYTPNIAKRDEINDLPTAFGAPGTDGRRTVSAITTPGGTAVGLVCDLSGHDRYMEWSNYGSWEELPLPPADQAYNSDATMNQAELFCGLDGRWHIIYHEYDTDAVFIRSTL